MFRHCFDFDGKIFSAEAEKVGLIRNRNAEVEKPCGQSQAEAGQRCQLTNQVKIRWTW